MICARQTKTNGERSQLFDKLYEITKDESTAEELYSFFSSPYFNEMFLRKDNKGVNVLPQTNPSLYENVIDDNFEPILHYHEKLKKYYFIDNQNELHFYPYSQGLEKTLKSNEIKSLAKSIALKYFLSNFKINVENFNIERINNESLTEFVTNFISKKVDELSSSEDIDTLMKGMALEETSDFISEWVNEVKDFFISLKLDVTEENLEQDLQAEDFRGEVVRVESFLKSSKNNVNENVKLFLSLIPGSKLNSFNEVEFLPFDSVWNTLNKSLFGIIGVETEEGLEDEYDLYLDKIKEVSKRKPEFSILVARMSNQNEIFKNQIVNAFRLSKKNYLTSEISKTDGISYKVMNVSDVTSLSNNLLNQWSFNYDQKVLSEPQLKNLKTKFKTAYNNLTSKSKKIKSLEELSSDIQTFKGLLNQIGVTLGNDQRGLDYFLDGQSSNIDHNVRLNNLLKAYQNILQGLDRVIDGKTDDLFKDQAVFKDLGNSIAFFIEEGSDASIFAVGKSKWVYSLPSYLDVKISTWKKNPKALIDLYESSSYYKSSHYMKFLTADEEGLSYEDRIKTAKERLNKIELTVFNSIQEEEDSRNAKDNTSLQYVDALADYINKLLAYRKNDKVYHKTALAADKSTEYQIHYGNDIDVFNIDTKATAVEGYVIVSDQVTDIFYEYFKGEYLRMKEVSDAIKNLNKKDLIKHYHTGENPNGLKSQLFPSLSHENYNAKEFGIELYDSEGHPLLDNLDDNEISEVFKRHIRNILSNNILELYEKLHNKGIISINNKGEKINNGIDSSIYNDYLKNSTNTSQAILKMAADIFVNSSISQIEYSKMFTGDVAYYKHSVDYKKRVPETYTDGQYMRINKGEENFKVAVIDSVEIPIPYKKEFTALVGKKIADKYIKKLVNSADAQAWITPERWKFIMERLGKWSDVHKSVYDKMNSNDKNTTFTAKELKLLGQPLKGVYFDNQNGHPVFLKYSQAVLWKPLIKGTSLQKLRDKMGNNIDEVITIDGVKVGAKGIVKSHDVNGNVLDSFKLNPITLNNKLWKLQQDLPVKGFKQTDVGSQIQKIIFQGLVYNQNEIFSLEGKEMTGNELAQHLHNIMGDLSTKGLNKVLKKLGVNKDTFKIENEEKMYDSLITQLKKRKDVPANFIKSLEAFTSPYGTPGFFEMFQNSFSSLINNNTIKIKTNGGGFIQMSDYGLSKEDVENQNIIFTPWMNTSKLPTPRIYEDEETGRKRVSPGGVFISGSLLAKYIPNYKELDGAKLFGTYNSETDKYEGGIIDEEILRNVIGYRIPNQGLPSNDAFEILGILPEAVGDMIVPYTGITTKTGSDFDIDKMYLMLPSFKPRYHKNTVTSILKETGLTQKIAKQILVNEGIDILLLDNPIESLFEYLSLRDNFDELPDDLKQIVDLVNEKLENKIVEKLEYIRPDINQPLENQSEAQVQNLLISAFKAVLTNEKVLPNIMQPLDLEDIANDIVNMFPEPKRSDLLDFDAITDLDSKFEFQNGKAGLGQNVNSLVDAVRGAMAKIYMPLEEDSLVHLLNLNINDGVVNFDNKSSVELTDKEIDEYVEIYNRNVDNVMDFITKDYVKENLKSMDLFDSMMALVNAFVDIAKDPYIVRGNWTTLTNNLGFYMLRAGAHPFYVNAFLGQPVIKSYIEFVNNQESIVVNNSGNMIPKFLKEHMIQSYGRASISINNIKYHFSKLVNDNFDINEISDLHSAYTNYSEAKSENKDAKYKKYLTEKTKFSNKLLQSLRSSFKTSIKNEELILLHEELMEKYENYFENNVEYTKVTLKDLKENIYNNNIESPVFNTKLDIKILKIFEELMKVSKDLNKSTNSAKVDVNGKGKNITELLITENRMNDFLNSDKILGGISKFNFSGQDTFLKTYYNNSVLIPKKIMEANPKYFLTASKSVQNTFNYISSLLYDTDLMNEELGSKLEKSFYTYVMSNFKPLQISEEEKVNLLNSLPKTYSEKLAENPDNKLLQKLYIKKGDNNRSYLAMRDGKLSTTEKNALIDAWKDLLEFDSEFGENLIKYSYTISGFNKSINQFHEYIPYEWFNKNRFNSYLKGLNVNQEIDLAFVDQFFRNNTEDNQLVKKVFDKRLNRISPNIGFFEGFLLPQDKPISYLVKRTVKDEFSQQNVDYFYKFEGYYLGSPMYVRTNVLGAKDSKNNRVIEYNFNNTNFKSSLKSNNKSFKISDEVKSILESEELINILPETIEETSVNIIKQEVQSQQLSFENKSEDLILLEEMFDLNTNLFTTALGINSKEELQSKSSEELGELINKLCG